MIGARAEKLAALLAEALAEKAELLRELAARETRLETCDQVLRDVQKVVLNPHGCIADVREVIEDANVQQLKNFLITEVVTYIVPAVSEKEAEEIFVSADDQNLHFQHVESRVVRPAEPC